MGDSNAGSSLHRPLPPGQSVRGDFPRFGLAKFANRFPAEAERIQLTLGGDLTDEFVLDETFQGLPQIEQHSDFHCVTTWSASNLAWRGYRFHEFYSQIVSPRLAEGVEISCVTFRCQDGYTITSLLEDLLMPDVMLAVRLEGASLDVSHGAPLRLVAPAQYGYKNPKHIRVIEFWCSLEHYRSPGLSLMDHPRARVAQEERGRYLPGVIYRWLYRPLIKSTVRQFRHALDAHNAQKGR